MSDPKPRENDILRIPKFMDHRPCWKCGFVGGRLKATKEITFKMHGDVHWTLNEKRKGGWSRASQKVSDMRVHEDLSSALWRVTSARMSGGGAAMGNDVYADGWCVRATRCNEDGSDHESGYTISFYTSGSFIPLLDPKDVHILGRMTRDVSYGPWRVEYAHE